MPRSTHRDDDPDDDLERGPQIDLHGKRPEEAERLLGRALHAARVQRALSLLVVTGKGMGNLEQKPILRERIEKWLGGAARQLYRVRNVERVHGGGALVVHLRYDA